MSVLREPGVPITTHVQELDGRVEYGILEERFGIPPSVFAPYLLFKPNRKALWLCRRDLAAPERPAPHAVGFPFFYVNMRWPRPTTSAILRFGHHADRNLVDLSDDQIAAFLHREQIPIAEDAASPWTGHGYLIARHRGLILGLGVWRPFVDDEETGGDGAETYDEGVVGLLQGMCPKSWTSRLGIEAPIG